MNKIKTIQEKFLTAEIIEKKSRFIANVFYVESVNEAEEKIKEIKKKYHDAKHNCYAYLIIENGNILKKFSDDGEPSGTAGAPMLDALEKKGLYNIIVIVTRYFGGILLGTGGLVRAYTEALKKTISSATIVNQEKGYEIGIKIPYADFEKFKYYCEKNAIVLLKTEYSDLIKCNIELNENGKNHLLENIQNENTFNISSFDIIRQKNVTVMSNNVD